MAISAQNLAPRLLAVGLLAAVVGCAGPGRPPAAGDDVQGLSPIGADLRAAPRGTTIPPATFGVDLVGSRTIDPATPPADRDRS